MRHGEKNKDYIPATGIPSARDPSTGISKYQLNLWREAENKGPEELP